MLHTCIVLRSSSVNCLWMLSILWGFFLNSGRNVLANLLKLREKALSAEKASKNHHLWLIDSFIFCSCYNVCCFLNALQFMKACYFSQRGFAFNYQTMHMKTIGHIISRKEKSKWKVISKCQVIYYTKLSNISWLQPLTRLIIIICWSLQLYTVTLS